MPRCQNALFRGAAQPDSEFEHPPGASVARLLASQLPADGWAVAQMENWRDCGWLLSCSRDNHSLDLVVASHDGSELWMLQIAATRSPLFARRWLGATPSADCDAIHALSQDAHAILMAFGFSDSKWTWDGNPASQDATAEPQPAPAT